VDNNQFKSSVFGGFNRDDVIRYIEKAALENQSRIDELEKENDGLCRENADLRKELDSVSGERGRLHKACDSAAQEQETLKKSVAQAQSALASLRAQLAEAQSENASLLARVKELTPQVEEYNAVKSHISELELAARQRADALEQDVRAKLAATIDQCTSECSYVISMLGTTCNHVSEELRKSDASLSKLPSAFNALCLELDEISKFKEN